jgi:hypothetical protein
MRGYLELCLPPYIEARITESIAKAMVTPSPVVIGVPVEMATPPLVTRVPAPRRIGSAASRAVPASPKFGLELVTPSQ